MRTIELTNSLTRAKEIFTPADPKRVTMYVCGPTVYNYAHIGNARPPVVFDVLFRLLRRTFGEEHVIYARNFTDIDDKIIARMNETGENLESITNKYADIYEADMAALGVLPPTLAPRATAHVSEMIALIETLIAKGAAYLAQSGVYFSVAADADYGKLSGRDLDDVRAGARVEGEDDKRAPADFALWKAAKPGEPAWDAPFGRGRPGWHIECSAMIEKTLGRTIDIHGGGIDLLFPHHENEIAQSECAHGAPLARVWLHNGFLTMDAEKMSKSVGNVQLAHELLQHWPGEVLRYALLSAHYRAPLDWTEDLLLQSRAHLDRLYQVMRDAKDQQSGDFNEDAVQTRLVPFEMALMDDINTPRAIAELAVLGDELRAQLTWISRGRGVGGLSNPYEAIRRAGEWMGLLQSDADTWFRAVAGSNQSDIDALVSARFAARKAKNFEEADRIREELTALGVIVMDGPEGSTWRRA